MLIPRSAAAAAAALLSASFSLCQTTFSVSSPVGLPPGTGLALNGRNAYDLNQDGDLDLIWARAGAQSSADFGWSENQGAGLWASAEQLSPGLPSHGNRDVGAEDLDGDGDLDVYTCLRTAGLGVVRWAENLGNGQFDAAANLLTLNIPAGYDFRACTADIDGDGDPDLVTVGPGVTIFENLGAGAFAPRPTVAPNLDIGDVAAGDLDGDGDVDLAVTNNPGFGTGMWSLVNQGGFSFSLSAPLLVERVYDHKFVDVDGDLDLDLLWCGAAAGGSTATAGWLENGGSGSFASSQALLAGGSVPSVTTSDLDGDGDQDFVFAGGAQGWGYREQLGSNSASFSPLVWVTTQTSYGVECADMDNDLDLDVISIGGSGYGVWFNDKYSLPSACIDPNFGTSLGSAADTIHPAQPIGLSFALNGQVYTDVHISDHGIVWLSNAGVPAPPAAVPTVYNIQLADMLANGPCISCFWADATPGSLAGQSAPQQRDRRAARPACSETGVQRDRRAGG